VYRDRIVCGQLIEFPLERRSEAAASACHETDAKVLEFRPRRQHKLTGFAGIELPEAVCGSAGWMRITSFYGYQPNGAFSIGTGLSGTTDPDTG